MGMSSATARAARREPGARSSGSWFRWISLAAAAAVLLFVAGAALGRPLGLGGGEPTKTSDVPRVLGFTADVLQGQGYNLAQLQTPDGTPGGFVAVMSEETNTRMARKPCAAMSFTGSTVVPFVS